VAAPLANGSHIALACLTQGLFRFIMNWAICPRFALKRNLIAMYEHDTFAFSLLSCLTVTSLTRRMRGRQRDLHPFKHGSALQAKPLQPSPTLVCTIRRGSPMGDEKGSAKYSSAFKLWKNWGAW
jgi:hypothetical protein